MTMMAAFGEVDVDEGLHDEPIDKPDIAFLLGGMFQRSLGIIILN